MIRIMKLGDIPEKEIFARVEPPANVEETVKSILSDVRDRGDSALFEYSKKFDGADLKGLEVTEDEKQEALENLDPELLRIIKRAEANIRNFHSRQIRQGFIINEDRGIVMGQKVMPVETAGIYVPGGTASYPSTVLMDTVPAKLAGVKQIVMTTPAGKDGKIKPAILAAAVIAGVDRIFKIGGAQAVAALAFGTETVPRADKIVGPGNAFVAEAKRQVSGIVSIDMIAGPTEILIIADGKSDPDFVAADLLSQAEHDRLSSAVLVTDSEELAYKVQSSVEKQIEKLERRDIARASIDTNGKIILAQNLEDVFDISNRIAPEHLEICLDSPFDWLDRVKNAGSVFLGRYCPEALGDYMAGPNHTLPTGGSARFSSPLSVDDFVKKTQYTYFTEEAFRGYARDIAGFAGAEGLTGHAKSALIRLGKEDE